MREFTCRMSDRLWPVRFNAKAFGPRQCYRSLDYVCWRYRRILLQWTFGSPRDQAIPSLLKQVD